LTAGTTTTTSTTAPVVPPPIVTTDTAVNQEVAYIESAQLSDGAFTVSPGSSTVDPYQSGYDALGLAEATVLTNNPAPATAAWTWLDWYQANEGVDGIVTDATVVRGVTVPTGTVDSTDATSGVFLMAAAATWAATGNVAQLESLSKGITGAVQAIETTQAPNGLTWARPGYDEAYLMDESEVYGGLTAVGGLAAGLADSVLAKRAAADASRLSAAVATLWDPATGAYDWAESSGGVRQTTVWADIYPDALEQLWAVTYGLVPAARATELLKEFQADQPHWADPTAQALERGANGVASEATIEYWPVGVWALSAAGQAKAAIDAEALIRSAAQAATNAWPYTPAIAAELIVGQETLAPTP
jgi:hypothetical protein